MGDAAFNIAKNLKYDRYQHGLASMVYKFFDKKLLVVVLAEKPHKPIIRIFKKLKGHSIDNIWGADLADMQLISKFDKVFRFLLYVIDNFRKYALVIPLKNKKETTITNSFQKILDESNRKPKKIWVDKGSKFYNRSIK